jgi:hypothetical protein
MQSGFGLARFLKRRVLIPAEFHQMNLRLAHLIRPAATFSPSDAEKEFIL